MDHLSLSNFSHVFPTILNLLTCETGSFSGWKLLLKTKVWSKRVDRTDTFHKIVLNSCQLEEGVQKDCFISEIQSKQKDLKG